MPLRFHGVGSSPATCRWLAILLQASAVRQLLVRMGCSYDLEDNIADQLIPRIWVILPVVQNECYYQ